MQATRDFPFQLSGEAREHALAQCQVVLRDWGLTMPAGEALVLDFGLGQFQDIGEVEFWVANEEAHGYCGKFLFVNDGQTCPYHRHDHKHETFFVLKGRVSMLIEGQERILHEGDVLAMSPGQHHAFTGIGPALLLEVSMPSLRQDNFFADQSIGDRGII